jgi:hypothetical protein
MQAVQDLCSETTGAKVCTQRRIRGFEGERGVVGLEVGGEGGGLEKGTGLRES